MPGTTTEIIKLLQGLAADQAAAGREAEARQHTVERLLAEAQREVEHTRVALEISRTALGETRAALGVDPREGTVEGVQGLKALLGAPRDRTLREACERAREQIAGLREQFAASQRDLEAAYTRTTAAQREGETRARELRQRGDAAARARDVLLRERDEARAEAGELREQLITCRRGWTAACEARNKARNEARERLETAEAELARLRRELETAREQARDGCATDALADVRRILGAAEHEGARRAAIRVVRQLAAKGEPRAAVGDRVRIVEPYKPAAQPGGWEWSRGCVGVVQRVDGAGDYLVRLAGDEIAWASVVEPPTYCWPATARMSEAESEAPVSEAESEAPVSEAPAQPEPKVGDLVRLEEAAYPSSKDREGWVGTLHALPDRDGESIVAFSEGRRSYARRVSLVTEPRVGDRVRLKPEAVSRDGVNRAFAASPLIEVVEVEPSGNLRLRAEGFDYPQPVRSHFAEVLPS